MKYLKYKRREGGHYIIINQSDIALGTIEKGDLFSNRMVFTSFDIIEWTAECLQEVTDFMKSLESKERRRTSTINPADDRLQ